MVSYFVPNDIKNTKFSIFYVIEEKNIRTVLNLTLKHHTWTQLYQLEVRLFFCFLLQI